MSTFTTKAPKVMADLMRDFPFTKEDAAAVLGNAGHESGGLVSLQEIQPTVAGSRGGYGWFQWTGPRRVAFEGWCAKMKMSPASDAANYGFLVEELDGPEKAAVNATRNAKTLNDKVIAFEGAYERAGVKNYPSRQQWALQALDAYNRTTQPVADNPGVPSKPAAKPVAKVAKVTMGAVVAYGAILAAHTYNWSWAYVGAAIAVVVLVAIAAHAKSTPVSKGT